MDRFGISVALLTPFTETGAVDYRRLGKHACHVLDEGVAGVTLFGTTGEGASVSKDERKPVIEAVLAASVPSSKLVLGICETALDDAIAAVAEGWRLGIKRYLVLPPYYYKGCSDDGLFDWHMALVAACDPGARFILYHIPQVSGVPLSVDLVGRLAAAAPDRFQAVKDSAGDWSYNQTLLRQGAMPVLVGDERLLHKAVPMGAEGSICGMANLYPARLVRLFNTAIEDNALSAEVTEVLSHPVIPAIKALLAEQSGEPGWERLRLPLKQLDPNSRARLIAARWSHP